MFAFSSFYLIHSLPGMEFLYVFCIGTLFGSFSNVYFYRFCEDLSIVFPNSFCPKCRNSIRWFDNIPLISYAVLKGKCRQCASPIPWTYPVTELTCGLLFLALHAILQSQTTMILLAYLFLFFIIFLIAGTDLFTYFETGMQYGIIPDSLVVILATGAILFSFFNPYVEFLWPHSAIGGAIGLSIGLSIRWIGDKIFRKEALGMGDVKLVGAIGLLFGWQGVLSTIFFGSLIGSVISLALIAAHKIRKDSAVPFGPFLALGSISGFFI